MFSPTRAGILLLYRHILKSAAVFPSKNRLGLIKEIKVEFRESVGITDGVEIRRRLAVARDGLDRMSAFSGASRATCHPPFALYRALQPLHNCTTQAAALARGAVCRSHVVSFVRFSLCLPPDPAAPPAATLQGWTRNRPRGTSPSRGPSTAHRPRQSAGVGGLASIDGDRLFTVEY